MGTSLAIHRKTDQRRVVLAYKILFLFFSNGIVHSDVMNDIFQALTTNTLIIKQVLPKYSDSYIFNWYSRKLLNLTKSGRFTLHSIKNFFGLTQKNQSIEAGSVSESKLLHKHHVFWGHSGMQPVEKPYESRRSCRSSIEGCVFMLKF